MKVLFFNQNFHNRRFHWPLQCGAWLFFKGFWLISWWIIVYSYFIATRGTIKLLSLMVGKQWEQWETVARGRRRRAKFSQIFSTTEGHWFDYSPSSLEITVLLPNCFKSPKHCQKYTDARRWHRGIWRFVTSFVTWPVNSALLTDQQFFSVARIPRSCKIIVQQSKMRNIDRALGNNTYWCTATL